MRLSTLAWSLLLAVACVPAEVRTVRREALAGNLLFLRGGGGNSVVLVSGGSALIFDPKMWPWDGAVAETLRGRAITSLYVVNSHAHEDHSLGNLRFPEGTILAAPLTVESLQRNALSDQLPRPGAVPSVSVRKRLGFFVGGEPVTLVHPGPAHTGGDVYAWLPRQRVLVTGDLFVHRYYPHVDRALGGTYLGYLTVLEELCSYPAETVIPGHGARARREDVVAMRDFLRGLRDSIAKLRTTGLADDAIEKKLSEPNGERLENLGSFSSRRDVVRGLLLEMPRR